MRIGRVVSKACDLLRGRGACRVRAYTTAAAVLSLAAGAGTSRATDAAARAPGGATGGATAVAETGVETRAETGTEAGDRRPAEPWDRPAWAPAFAGIELAEMVREPGDRPGGVRQAAFAARVDLAEPTLRVVASPGNGERPLDADLTPTTAFLAGHGLELAVNTHFFGPGGAAGTPTDLVGLAVSGGAMVSPWEDRMPASVLVSAGSAQVEHGEPASLEGVLAAAAGSTLVEDGRAVARGVAAGSRHPRTALGVDAEGRLLILVVDGRRPGHSGGATLGELAAWMIGLGAVDAINADGGGSSCLAVAGEGGAAAALNRPSDGAARAVGFSLGFDAEPQPSP